MASTQQVQLPQTAQVREMEEYINNSDFQQVQVELVPRCPAAVLEPTSCVQLRANAVCS